MEGTNSTSIEGVSDVEGVSIEQISNVEGVSESKPAQNPRKVDFE